MYYPDNDHGRRLTFTLGLTPPELIVNRLPHKYAMELTRADMLTVITALGLAIDYDIGEEACSLRAAILDTLGIEEV